jgi:hypothetical protein
MALSTPSRIMSPVSPLRRGTTAWALVALVVVLARGLIPTGFMPSAELGGLAFCATPAAADGEASGEPTGNDPHAGSACGYAAGGGLPALAPASAAVDAVAPVRALPAPDARATPDPRALRGNEPTGPPTVA